MKPTTTNIFVKETDKTEREIKKNNWEVVDSSRAPNYEVVAIGPDVKLCKVGDIVLFHNAHTQHFNDEEFLVFDESDLLGVHTNA